MPLMQFLTCEEPWHHTPFRLMCRWKRVGVLLSLSFRYAQSAPGPGHVDDAGKPSRPRLAA